MFSFRFAVRGRPTIFTKRTTVGGGGGEEGGRGTFTTLKMLNRTRKLNLLKITCSYSTSFFGGGGCLESSTLCTVLKTLDHVVWMSTITKRHCQMSRKPFSHDEKKQKTLLAKFSQCLRNLTKWASYERTVMFYMSYIPCEIFANIEYSPRRSRPTTKSYARVVFRMKPSTLRRPVRKQSYCACVKTHRAQLTACAMHALHCTTSGGRPRW